MLYTLSHYNQCIYYDINDLRTDTRFHNLLTMKYFDDRPLIQLYTLIIINILTDIVWILYRISATESKRSRYQKTTQSMNENLSSI